MPYYVLTARLEKLDLPFYVTDSLDDAVGRLAQMDEPAADDLASHFGVDSDKKIHSIQIVEVLVNGNPNRLGLKWVRRYDH